MSDRGSRCEKRAREKYENPAISVDPEQQLTDGLEYHFGVRKWPIRKAAQKSGLTYYALRR